MMALRNAYPACGSEADIPLLGPRRFGKSYWGGIFPIPLALSSEFRIPSSEFGNAPCAMRYARYSTGALCHLPSALCHQPSVICHLLSALCTMLGIPLGWNFVIRLGRRI